MQVFFILFYFTAGFKSIAMLPVRMTTCSRNAHCAV